MKLRPYDIPADRDGLWELKAAFERGLGASTGGETKRMAYEAKLTRGYRERYLEWLERCVTESADCVTVAEATAGLVGYAFLLPESLAHIWDAAVLNELYVAPPRRGTGLADDLLEAAVEAAHAQDLPIDRLMLDVDPENERARRFYDRHGFDAWGTLLTRGL